MGATPSAALAIRQQPEFDLGQAYGKTLQLKSLLQGQQLQQEQGQENQLEIQQKQQGIADQQAMTAAMHEWDGKNVDELPSLILKHNGSANAVFSVKQQILASKEKLSAIAKDDAETGAKNLDTLAKKNDLLLGKLQTVTDGPSLLKAAQDAVNEGILDPQHAQQAQQIAQLPPDQFKQTLSVFEKSLQGQKAQFDQAMDQRKVAAEELKANTEAQKFQMEKPGGPMESGAVADARYRSIIERQKLGQQLSPQDLAAKAAYEKQKTLVPTATFNLQNGGLTGQGGEPSDIAKMIASGQMKWGDAISARTPLSVKAAMAAEVKKLNPDFNTGDFDVEKKVRELYTSGPVAQQLLAINTAREHMKTFTEVAAALDNGDVQSLNKLGNALGIQFGSDKATNFRIAAQAFGGEVGRAFDGAGVIGAEREQAQNNFNAAMSKGQFKGAIQIVDKLLAGKQKSAQDTYEINKQGKPNFGSQGTQGGGIQVKDPRGVVHTFPDQASADNFKKLAHIQ